VEATLQVQALQVSQSKVFLQQPKGKYNNKKKHDNYELTQ